MNTALKHSGKAPGNKRKHGGEEFVMEAPSPEVAALKGVLVAMDFTPESQKALDFAVKLLQNHRQAHLYMIHAVTTHTLPGSEVSPDSLLLNMQVQEESMKEAKSKMEEKVEYARSHGIAKPKGLVVVSDPVSAIVNTAEELKADLIVLGNRRRGYARGIIFGSVSERVAADSPMSVLIVR